MITILVFYLMMFDHVSGIHNYVFLSGRGYGECSILWKSSMKRSVSPVIMNTNRICAVSITTHNMSLLLFNMYMPCKIRDNDGLYCDIFSEVMRVCNILDCSNFIIGDDLNTSFQCVSSNLTKRLNYICDDESIKPCIGFEGNN